MTDDIDVRPEVLLVLEAKRLMTEYTFALPRFRSSFQDTMRRVVHFDPENPKCLDRAIDTVRDAYEELAFVEIKDKDFPVFAEWGRKAWEFMPAPSPVGNYAHALPKCEQADHEWFSRNKKGWQPNDPKIERANDYEALLRQTRITYENQLHRERVQRSYLADQLDAANARLTAASSNLLLLRDLRARVDELIAENAALKLQIKERGNE